MTLNEFLDETGDMTESRFKVGYEGFLTTLSKLDQDRAHRVMLEVSWLENEDFFGTKGMDI